MQERDILDRTADGSSRAATTTHAIVKELLIPHDDVDRILNHYRDLGLVAYHWGQGWYITAPISKYFEVRAEQNFS